MICQFAHHFPKTAGEFLDRAATLGRSFREETLTDVLMGALVAFRPLGVEVHFPDEPRTGADMEWLFVRADGSSYFRLLIQAKKLHGSGKIWSRRSYPEIFHRVRKTGILQSETLVDEARRSRSTCPLYIFYTHQSVCDLAGRDKQILQGISLVSGTFINALVKNKVAGTLGATQASSLGVIQPKMFPLSHLLCSGARRRTRGRRGTTVLYFLAEGGQVQPSIGVPTPEAIRTRLINIVGPDHDIPPVGEGSPDVEEKDAARDDSGRFRVIFWSLGHDEERGWQAWFELNGDFTQGDG